LLFNITKVALQDLLRAQNTAGAESDCDCHVSEQRARYCYVAGEWPRVEPVTLYH